MTQEVHVPASQVSSDSPAETPETFQPSQEPYAAAPASLLPSVEKEKPYPKAPPEWEEPVMLPDPVMYFEDVETGLPYPVCLLCEWCRSHPAEWHEMNHDCFLCADCTFREAPVRPVQEVKDEPLYTEAYCKTERHDGTADDVTWRIAHGAVYALLHAQGGVPGILYFEQSGEGYPEALISSMVNVADVCRMNIPFPWEKAFQSEEPMDWEFFGLVQEYLALSHSRDPLLACLRCACRSITAKTANERRAAALKAMEEARYHVKRLPVIEGEDETPPEDGGTPSPAPVTEEGHSHAEPPAASVPVRSFAARPPQRHRRRVPDGEPPRRHGPSNAGAV